jgi:drug/metabolite transporter (DMT)-like permease
VRPSDYARLILLAALWGASFIFIRSAAPAFGALPTAWVRVTLGGGVLIAYARLIGLDLDWRNRWRHYAIIGVLSSALPFSFFSYAALHLPASFLAICNSTASLFGAVFAAVWLQERLTDQACGSGDGHGRRGAGRRPGRH